MRLPPFWFPSPRDFGRGVLALALVGIALAPAPAQAARKGTPTLVEVDFEGDLGDLLALTLAVRRPELDVVGVVTSKSPNSERARALSRWLEFLDRPDIEVGEGGEVKGVGPLPAILANEEATGPIVPATRLISSAAQRAEPSLQVLIIGTGYALAEALTEDPLRVSRLRRIVWTQPPDSRSAFAGLDEEGALGALLFGATCALVACDPSRGATVSLGREDWIDLGKAHSALTDELTALAARLQRESGSDNRTIEAPHTLSVAFAAGLSAGARENESVVKAENGDFVFAATGERKILRVTPPATEDLRDYLFKGLTDSSLYFRVQFANFLNALLRMDIETKNALKGKLDKSFGKEDQKGKTRREMMMAYLEGKLKVLKEHPKPTVALTLGFLEEAYLSYAGLGWWFPDEFYPRWRFDPSTDAKIRFGIDNPGGLPLSDIAAAVRIGEVSLSQTVDSASSTVRFEFDFPPRVGDWVQTASAELSWRFDRAGVTIERSRYLEILTD